MSNQSNVQINENAEVKTVGFETQQDLLDEINYRFQLINKNNIFLQKIPKSLTRIALKDLIPEMITSRFPETSKQGKVNYAFIQLPTEALVNKYIEILNEKVIRGKKLVAKKHNQSDFKEITNFDLKQLYFNGLKPETKYSEIKALYPNAKIIFPIDDDKNSKGSVTLVFKTEEEAFNAFMGNKMTLHGLKCHLNFYIKPTVQLKFSFNKPDELIKEIISRFELQNNRTVMIKNLPANYTLGELKEFISVMRNCKISTEKRIAFIEFDTVESANNSAKELNNKLIKNSKIRAFVVKTPVLMNDLTNFNLNKLHLTNLSMDTTESDIKSVFKSCEVELSKNTDNTCLGNATLSFSNSQEALKYFCQSDLKVKSLSVIINFHSEVKSTENKKRKLEDSDDHELDCKKSKVVPKISEETSEPIEIKEKKSLIPKSKKRPEIVKESLKAEQKGESVKTPVEAVPKKSLLPVKMESIKKPKTKEQSNGKRNSNGNKQSINEPKVVPGKRKFQEIENDQVDNSIKKTKRVIATRTSAAKNIKK